jgi:hypothetical protein
MSKAKITAKDYKKEYNSLLLDIATLKARIIERLHFLCKQNPDVPVARQADLNGTIIKAKSIGDLNYIHQLDIKAQLYYIETIENWIAEQNPVKQTKINF